MDLLRAVLTLAGCKTWMGFYRGKQIISNILQGLEYLHGLGIAHLGLTSHNVMLDKEGQAKIANVGLGKFVSAYGTLPTAAGPPPVDIARADQWRGDAFRYILERFMCRMA